MANQYHDETGKFCSRDEMQGAVTRLMLAGKQDDAMILAKQFADLDREEAPATISSSATATATQTLVLQATPAEVVTVETAEAIGPKVDDAQTRELVAKAQQYVDSLAKIDIDSPDFDKALQQIDSLGSDVALSGSSGITSLLQRSVDSATGGEKNANAKVDATLSDLRSTIDQLAPDNLENRSGLEKLAFFIPGAKFVESKVKRYMNKYKSAQSHLNAIVLALNEGQDQLKKDNIDISKEKERLWDNMGKLKQNILLASKIDDAVVAKIADLKAQGKGKDANKLESDFLFAVRQRRQDLATQLSVSAQGYLALELTRRNNIELAKGVDRAKSTTIYALETAVVVSSALSEQQKVISQIDGVNATTSNMIKTTSENLKSQTAAIQRQAANSTIDIASLQTAFDNIFSTIESIDSFKKQANANFEVSINALQAQIEKAQPALNRFKAENNGETKLF